MVADVRKGSEKGFYTREKREGRARKEGEGISGHFYFLLIAYKTLVCVSVLFYFVCFSEKNFIQTNNGTAQFLPGGGVLLGILCGVVPPGSPNPAPISDQKIQFSTPVFRPDL